MVTSTALIDGEFRGQSCAGQTQLTCDTIGILVTPKIPTQQCISTHAARSFVICYAAGDWKGA